MPPDGGAHCPAQQSTAEDAHLPREPHGRRQPAFWLQRGWWSDKALHSLIDRLSKNGSVLLNIAPMADGRGNSANGATCQQAAWNGGHNQQWRLNSVGNGRHQIINRGTSTALDSLGNSIPGSGTAMWTPNNSPNNHLSITPV